MTGQASARYRDAAVRVLSLAIAVVLAAASGARSSCDILPSPPLTFRSSTASADRPFARPGDWVTLVLDARCHGASSGFTESPDDYAATVFFQSASGRRNAVMLTADCADFDGARQACGGSPGLDSIACIPAFHRVADGAGGFVDVPDLQVLSDASLRFRFPDTDPMLGAPDDDLTFAGPAAIAVTRRGESLPCDLGAAPCSGQVGLVACVDRLFAADGSCSPNPDPVFASFTALPPPNDFEAVCVPEGPQATSPCDGTVDELRFTTDAAGNVLIPVDWRGVLFRQDLVPVLRLVRAASPVEAYAGRGAPIRIPDLDVLDSFSLGGKPLPPLFDPLSTPDANGPVTLFGSADAPQTVLRIARHDRVVGQCLAGQDAGLPCLTDAQCAGSMCGGPRCTGGSNDGGACAAVADCPGGECGPGLFDFATRAAFDVGPVLLRHGACLGGTNALAACADDAACPGGQCGSFVLTALDPVPLDGLQQSDQINAFVLEEALENRDLNGDGDAVDHVVRLGDRDTGEVRPIGEAGADAVAVVRIQTPPFSFPAVAVDEDILSFLMPESLQGAHDQNGDGDVADTILRVFRLDGTEPTASLPAQAVEGLPVLNGRPLAISNGRVFFRSSEAARARRALERVNVSSTGEIANDGVTLNEATPDLCRIAFTSAATNLSPDDENPASDTYVRDRCAGWTRLVSVSSSGEQHNGSFADASGLSGNGRYVAFVSNAFNLDRFHPASNFDVFVHDFDTGRTEIVSVNSSGDPANGSSFGGHLSHDGRFVAFASFGDNLVAGDTNGFPDSFVHDRVTGKTVRTTVSSTGEQANRWTTMAFLSADGRHVVGGGPADNLVPDDVNGRRDLPDGQDPGADIFVRDLALGITERVNLDDEGNARLGHSRAGIFTPDARYVVFTSLAPLTSGDTNGTWDVFVRDRLQNTTTRVSVDSSGRQAESFGRDALEISGRPSANGRFVFFQHDDGSLAPGGSDGAFRHDRVTQITDFVHHRVFFPYLPSRDGHAVAFYQGLEVTPPGQPQAVFVLGPDPADCDSDLTGDCDLADTVLRVLAPSGALQTLCPATQVAVAAGRAAFLRPEGSGNAPGCPPPPLNDANSADEDEVVHLWDGTDVHNLGLAATGIAMSADWLAALVSESSQAGADANGDGDADDTVVQVHSATNAAAGWTNLAQAADAVDVAGAVVAFTTPEAAQRNVSLNGDADAADRVLQIYDAAAGGPVRNTTQAAEEFVLGASGLVAFRTREASQGNGGTDLNDDADTADDVLQVFESGLGDTLSSGYAVTPCRLEACDPRLPYRVRDHTVTFLTFEGDQSVDLNLDGDQGDLVLQVLNVAQARASGDPTASSRVLAATTAGVCTTTGASCTRSDDCAEGACFVPPGGCLRDTAIACIPPANPAPDPCPLGQFCQPLVGLPGQGMCRQAENACRTTADCLSGAQCNLDNAAFNRVVSPLLDPDGGGVVFTGSGRCIENSGRACAANADCDAGEFCSGGACQREHGSCVTDGDCPPATTCVADVALQTAADGDGDELPDPIDNCPAAANPAQDDTDGDGLGDACDVETCGNGRREAAEACDGADAPGCDGACSSSCTCPCETLVAREHARVVVNARPGRGILDARLRLALDDYAGEPVGVRLEDPDGTIVERNLGSPPPERRRRDAWRFTSKADGLRRLVLRKTRAGVTVRLRARRWIGAAADRAAAETTLTVTIGGRCFSTPVTRLEN